MLAVDSDIVAGFRHLWSAAGLGVLVTGGLHWQVDGVPPDVELPYAVLRVKQGDRIETATTLFVGNWQADVEVYCTTLRTEILRGLAHIDRTQAAWPPIFGRCVQAKPGGYEAPDGEQPHARDVYVLRAGWTLMIEQTRERAW